MRATLFVMLLALLCASAVVANSAPVVTERQFAITREDHEDLLVLYTRLNKEACPECVVAADTLEQYAKEGLPCETVIVNCDSTPTLCAGEGFEFLPQIKLIQGDYAAYRYEKNYIYLEALQDFVAKYLVAKTMSISTADALTAELQKHKSCVVGFFTEEENNKARGTFKRTAAELFAEHTFIEAVGEETLLLQFDAMPNGIKMYISVAGELQEETYSAEVLSRRRLVNWIADNAPWPVYEGEKSQAAQEARALPLLSVYVDYEDAAQKEGVVAAMERVANSYRNKVALVYTNGNDETYDGVFERWGYEQGQFPIMMISRQNPQPKVYTYEGTEVTEETIHGFVDAFLANSLEEHVIKQRVPVEAQGAVQVVVHDTWREVVHDSTSDVVVFFYLPEEQCPHCIAFLEIFEKAAETLVGVPDLVLTKLDVNANAQVPGVRVANFPTIQLYPMANKFNQEIYSGPRTEEAVRAWIMAHLSSAKGHQFTEEEQRLGLGVIA